MAGTLEEGLTKIKSRRVMVIGVNTDFLFPLHQQRELADMLQRLGRSVE